MQCQVLRQLISKGVNIISAITEYEEEETTKDGNEEEYVKEFKEDNIEDGKEEAENDKKKVTGKENDEELFVSKCDEQKTEDSEEEDEDYIFLMCDRDDSYVLI